MSTWPSWSGRVPHQAIFVPRKATVEHAGLATCRPGARGLMVGPYRGVGKLVQQFEHTLLV